MRAGPGRADGARGGDGAAPGERGDDWPQNTGCEPWPQERWPAVPTRFLLPREDRMFPADWMRGVVADRLGIEPDEIGGGHCPALARPGEPARRLEAYRSLSPAPGAAAPGHAPA